MHHPRTRDPFTSEPPARLTYDSFSSNVTEDLTGTETILLVEDDERLRILVHRILEVLMTGLSGVDLVKRVQRRFTSAAALSMSGRLSDALREDGTLRNGTAFIQKPFVPDALARKVLDGSPPPAPAAPSRHEGL